jgi:glycosyltransferase involved in cell wall biosynthesis
MRILQLVHYNTPKTIMHGGEIRVSEIKKKLELLGHDVCAVSIRFSEIEPSDYYNLVLPHPIKQFYDGIALIDDLILSCICKESKTVFGFLKQHLELFQPDMIFIEQPWLWPVISKMFQTKILDRKKIKVIYSSQNIEFMLKRDILLRAYSKQEGKKDIINTIVNDIKSLEEDLLKNIDGVICVTQIDANWIKEIANNARIIVANNGISKTNVSSADLTVITQALQNRRFALFVGSAHPPNMHGFWDMFGPSLANFPPDTLIIAVGGCSLYLYDYAPEESAAYLLVNQKILKCLGPVNEETLSALIFKASCIILPITVGGGSNLKTAEAIAACKPVVATSIACRGFDFARELSNFYIYDDRVQFSRMVVQILTGKQPILEIPNQEHALRASVYWDQALQPLNDLIRELI